MNKLWTFTKAITVVVVFSTIAAPIVFLLAIIGYIVDTVKGRT
jgi:hypothetical protein